MAVTTKRVTKKQREWLEHYERETGFEPLWQDELDRTPKTFNEIAARNVRWYEDHTSDVHLRIQNYPRPPAQQTERK